MSAPTWHWRLLRAGAFRLDGGSMFGVVPMSLWSRLVPPDELNRIPLQTNCLLLENDNERVLIETGYGDKWSHKDRHIFDMQQRCILDALADVEVDPADISHVIVTHLHFDHAAGLTRLDDAGNAQSVFPNAAIHIQQTEWNDALANKSTMTKTYLKNHLEPILEQVRRVDGEYDVLPGITVWPMPGHTWGQQAVRFNDKRGTVCFPGDVMPTINHVGPAFNMGYDMLPYQNMQSKIELLSRAQAEQWRIVLDHEPDNPVVAVGRDAERPDRFVLNALPVADYVH